MSDDAPSQAAIGDDDDDPSIDDADFVYRRVSNDHANVKDDPVDGRRASSAAFEDRDDGMSVYLHSRLIEAGLPVPAVVLEQKPAGKFLVARIQVAALRELGCGITRDPDPNGEAPHPCNPAHALVHLPPLAKRPLHRLRSAIAKSAELLD